MLRFVIQRLLFILGVVVSIVFAVHWGMLLISSTEGLWETGMIAGQESVEFLSQLLRGNLGSYETNTGEFEVSELLSLSVSASMGLLFSAALLAAVLGVALGIFVALTKRRVFSFSVLAVTMWVFPYPLSLRPCSCNIPSLFTLGSSIAGY